MHLATDHVERWDLEADGLPFQTENATLIPVRYQRLPAMLKISTADEEQRGATLLQWWDGVGAARIYKSDGTAVLMERACGSHSLAAMSMGEDDHTACTILCDTANALHRNRGTGFPALIPLHERFQRLLTLNNHGNGVLMRCAREASDLLEAPRDIRPLHGDLHHGNVLDFEARGWLAIDPKGLLGERAFDFANIFCNPDIDHPKVRTARNRLTFDRRLSLISLKSGIDPSRLLRWIVAWAGLSGIWFLDESDDRAEIVMEIAAYGIAHLDS